MPNDDNLLTMNIPPVATLPADLTRDLDAIADETDIILDDCNRLLDTPAW